MTIKALKCGSCGANLSGSKCEYCGTEYEGTLKQTPQGAVIYDNWQGMSYPEFLDYLVDACVKLGYDGSRIVQSYVPIRVCRWHTSSKKKTELTEFIGITTDGEADWTNGVIAVNNRTYGKPFPEVKTFAEALAKETHLTVRIL